MTVTFYRQTIDGEMPVGTIALVDGKLVATPADSIPLQNVLRQPVYLIDPQDRVTLLDSVLHPKEFLHALPTMYHGTYFWAGTVED